MSQEASKDNEISQDFEELVKNKDESPTNKSESDVSLSANSPEDDGNEQKMQQQQMQQQQMQQRMFQEQQMQQQMQQKMFQEQQMQQKMFQEQQKMQHKVLPKMVNNHHKRDSDDDSDEKSSDVKNINVKKVEVNSKNIESFTNEKSLNKTLATLGVLFALFFVFSSSQLEGALGGVSYLNNLPFPGQINLVIRALLFIIVYFLLDYFVL